MIMLSMQNAIFWFASHSDLTGGSQLSVEAIPYGNSTVLKSQMQRFAEQRRIRLIGQSLIEDSKRRVETLKKVSKTAEISKNRGLKSSTEHVF